MVQELVTHRTFVHIVGLKVCATIILRLFLAVHSVVGPFGLFVALLDAFSE